VSLAAGALVLAGLGAVGGAALYASFGPATTTTVVAPVPAEDDAPSVPAVGGMSASEIYRVAAPSVVELEVVKAEENPYLNNGAPEDVTGAGSGFVYNRSGFIVTNNHVVTDAKAITVIFPDNKTFAARIVGADPDSDLAVIKINPVGKTLNPLTLADSATSKVGDDVVAIGSPFGHAGSLSRGVVSGLHVPMSSPNDVPTDGIQTDTAINPGNSGGVLLNTHAQVLGITTSTQSRSGNSNGVGFVIPANTVRTVVEQIVAGRKVVHAYFGASLVDATSPLGAKLVTVPSAGPSAKAGMKEGDIVTSIDGIGIGESDVLVGLTKAHSPGDKVLIGYTRAGKAYTVEVELGTRPPE
jgi:S1-C subfamily serine protease